MIFEVERKHFVVGWSGSTGFRSVAVTEKGKKNEFKGVLLVNGSLAV